MARVELLRARPLQCFKCWGYGHVKSNCQIDKDRSNIYYRCGTEGHNARSCDEKPFCAICAEKGLNGQYRMGSLACTSANIKTRQTQTGRRTRATKNYGP